MRGLRIENMAPLNRGCVDKIIYRAKQDDEWVNLTSKRLWLTAKDVLWDEVTDDSNAIFKIEGQIPDTDEPGRVVFPLSEEDTNLNPDKEYYCDIVITDSDGTSNANRVFIGCFSVTGAPNNAQTGGNNE